LKKNAKAFTENSNSWTQLNGVRVELPLKGGTQATEKEKFSNTAGGESRILNVKDVKMTMISKSVWFKKPTGWGVGDVTGVNASGTSTNQRGCLALCLGTLGPWLDRSLVVE